MTGLWSLPTHKIAHKMNAKIWIEPTGKTLRLVWYYQGKRQRLSLGVADNPIGRALAAKKMADIKIDLESGHYDETLLKYKPRVLGANPTEISAVELFGKYVIHYKKNNEIAHGSGLRFKAIASKLEQFLGDKQANKVTESVSKEVVARWAESASVQTIKSYLYYLKGCWDWAKDKYHVVDPNPWDDCLIRARSRGNSKPSKQVKPFTIVELQAIISAFANNPYYAHYTDFVIFLVNTACRFGEAAGLKWSSLGADYSTAWIGESVSRGHQNAKGTKTGKSRTIQLSPPVRSMLLARSERINPQPDDLVFPSPKGLPLDDHNFNRRAWKTILKSCQIEYRSPYKLRHSAISHALANGANPIALAEQSGHDKRTMLSTYAHAIDRECLFVSINDRNYDD
jgi:integrase